MNISIFTTKTRFIQKRLELQTQAVFFSISDLTVLDLYFLVVF